MDSDALILARFHVEMAHQLYANRHKSHWREESPAYLKRRLKEEVKELIGAIDDSCVSGREVTAEAADVANFAMMIADVCGEL